MKPQIKSETSKVIIFDSGVLISFSMNGITDIVKKLKSVFKGKFIITSEIKNEIIDKPLKIKRFRLEAMKLKRLLDSGVLEMPNVLGISDGEIKKGTENFLNLSNTAFKGGDKEIHLLDRGECSCLALSEILTKKGIQNILAVDERTTRSLVENHEAQKRFLEKKLHVKIKVDHEKLKSIKGFKIIRSPELAYIAYKKGLIEMKEDSLDAILNALKYKGSAISGREIEEMKRLARENTQLQK